MQTAPTGGEPTLGTTACIWGENDAWDVLLNEQYQAVVVDFEKFDIDGAMLSTEDTNRVETLRAAQRAWVAYRDAECANVYAMFGSGSMRLPIGATCFLNETAERTIELWAKRGYY